jgi:hypothetical protein
MRVYACFSLDFQESSNPQADDEALGRGRLLTDHVGVYLSVVFMARISFHNFTNISREESKQDDTRNIITFRLREQFRLRLRLKYLLYALFDRAAAPRHVAVVGKSASTDLGFTHNLLGRPVLLSPSHHRYVPHHH